MEAIAVIIFEEIDLTEDDSSFREIS